MCDVQNLCKYCGGIRALDDCSFKVEKGSITALTGPNGAGETTAFNCISRTAMPTRGEVWLDGERIDPRRPPQDHPHRAEPHFSDQPQPGPYDGAGQDPPLARPAEARNEPGGSR
jgi:ABC-type branched-subunit amino acid transport system ATPase component